MLSFRRLIIRSILCCAAAGCAESLRPDVGSEPADEPDQDEIEWVESGNFKFDRSNAQPLVSEVDASSTDQWQRLDLDTRSAVGEDEGWDIAFQRYHVIANGGVSGEGGVEVAVLTEVDFRDLERAPAEGFETDAPDGEEDDDEISDNPFNGGPDRAGWYAYNLMTHELKPHPFTYVIVSTERRYYKLVFDSYYDESGTPAIVRFRWTEIDPAE